LALPVLCASISSVAEFWMFIPDPNFSIPDPESEFSIPDPNQLSILTQKIVSKLSQL
jgi:hypothetical protein